MLRALELLKVDCLFWRENNSCKSTLVFNKVILVADWRVVGLMTALLLGRSRAKKRSSRSRLAGASASILGVVRAFRVLVTPATLATNPKTEKRGE